MTERVCRAGFSAVRIAFVSPCETGGAFGAAVAEGRLKTQPPKPARERTTTATPQLRNVSSLNHGMVHLRHNV